MRIFLTFIYCLSTLLLFTGCAEEKQPNIVFILADDLGWTDIAANNPNTFYETPNIDRIAEEGITLTNAYAACPVCSPTRASIMTGLYPARMNTTDWFGAPQPDNVEKHWTRNKPLLPAPYTEHLDRSIPTIAEDLRFGGYKNFFAGKWHLGTADYYPTYHGFDINKGGYESGSPRGGYYSPYKNPKLKDGPEGECLPIRLAEETVAFIDSMYQLEKPFFTFLSFYSVHTPLQTSEVLKQKYEEKKSSVSTDAPEFLPEGERMARQVQNHPVYAGMMESMDDAVGIVLDALDRLGISEETIVVFTSDNGGLSTSEGSPTSNLPLRAGKGWLYEGGIRVPTFMRWPQKIAPGGTLDEPVSSIDFYKSLLSMAEVTDTFFHDGIDISHALTSRDTLPDRDLFWHYPHYGNQGGSPGSAIRSGPYKLIHFYEDDRVELYDLSNDIGEQNDLSNSQIDTKEALLNKLETWRKSVGARKPSPNPNAAEPTE